MKIQFLLATVLLTAYVSAAPKHKEPAYKPLDSVLNCSIPDGHHILSETAKCPLGGKSYSSLTYMSYSTYGVNTDWEPMSYLTFPLPIAICANGFIVDKDDMTKEEIATRKAFIESEAYQELFKQKHASYFLFAKQVEALKDKNVESLWWYYLKATWEAKNCNNQARYSEYANLVITEAQKRKANITDTAEEFWTLSIIIPEMYRRIGDFDAAQKELNKIAEPKLPEPKTNEFYLLAKNIIQQAITEKSTQQLPIKSKDEEEPKN